MRVLYVDQKNKILELTLKELIVKGKKKMLTSFDDLKHGKKFSGVVVGESHDSYIIKFFNNLKGFLRFEEAKY